LVFCIVLLRKGDDTKGQARSGLPPCAVHQIDGGVNAGLTFLPFANLFAHLNHHWAIMEL